MELKDLKVDVYADGAEISEMVEMYRRGFVKGFTTNPTLMKKAGVEDYTKFVKNIVDEIPDLPISFEVFADDFETMRKEAKKLSSFGRNVYVKIPITNSRGESSIGVIEELSKEGIRLNVTAVFTVAQVQKAVKAFTPDTENIVSVFAGRIADTGRDPEEVMKETVGICSRKKKTKCLWASCREVFNIFQADRCGVDIITVTYDILDKLTLLGRDLEEFSLETVRMFEMDSRNLGFKI